MKTYGAVEVYLHSFLTSGQDGGEWSGLRPGPPVALPLVPIG